MSFDYNKYWLCQKTTQSTDCIIKGNISDVIIRINVIFYQVYQEIYLGRKKHYWKKEYFKI